MSLSRPSKGSRRRGKPYLDLANWLWTPIIANPALESNSAAIVANLASTAGGAQRVAQLYDYGVRIVGASQINGNTPLYSITAANSPAWGANPFPVAVRIPLGTTVPPGTDGGVVIVDPISKVVTALWQAVYNSGANTWSCSWGAQVPLNGDGIETGGGSSTATNLSRLAAVVTADEIARGEIKHALVFSTDSAKPTTYKYPAQKTDGDNASGTAAPIEEGTRVQLDPSINVDAIPNITAAEKVIAKALQVYGAYCGDKGSSRMGFSFEHVGGTSPGAVYVANGLEWDYFDMSHIPWSSLRTLQKWDGTAVVTGGPSGMTKNADQFAGNGGMFQMTGWTPDVGSTVTADGLVVSASGGTIMAKGTGKNTVLGSSNSNISLRKNGVEVATGSWSGNNPAQWTLAYYGVISANDVFTLWAGNGGDAYTFMVAGSTVKHLTSAIPMGVDKSGTQQMRSSFGQVTGWTIRSGYLNTVIANNAIVVASDIPNAVIAYQGTFAGVGITSNVKAVRLLLNGVVVDTQSATGGANNGSFVTRGGVFNLSLVAGDVITMEAMHGSATASNRVIQAGAAYTFITVDLPT